MKTMTLKSSLKKIDDVTGQIGRYYTDLTAELGARAPAAATKFNGR